MPKRFKQYFFGINLVFIILGSLLIMHQWVNVKNLVEICKILGTWRAMSALVVINEIINNQDYVC